MQGVAGFLIPINLFCYSHTVLILAENMDPKIGSDEPIFRCAGRVEKIPPFSIPGSRAFGTASGVRITQRIRKLPTLSPFWAIILPILNID